MSLRQRIMVVVLAPLGLLAAGTLGYRAIQHWSWFDALYMAVITLTTVGFGEVHPLGAGGRAFTIVLALGGVFTLFFTTTEVIRSIVSGEVQAVLGRRRMEKKMEALVEHVIICGYGRMGRQVCQEFLAAGVPVVVVDKAEDRLAGAVSRGVQWMVADATDDATLARAGLDRARALVAVAATDADNVFITMSARLLNPRIPIIARAEEESTIGKLVRAGATRVVSPYVLGGGRVAQAVLRPAVLDFIEVATRSEHLDLQIEELPVRSGGPLEGRALVESGLRAVMGLIVVAIKQSTGHMVFNPPDDTRLASGDTLIVLGRRDQLDRADRHIATTTRSAPAPQRDSET
jgi:voltage-gated potassium channel